MSITEHDETMENVNMIDDTDTSKETIVKDIIDLTDRLETAGESNKAWSTLQHALYYLSAKDTMLKYKEEINNDNKNI